MATEKRTYPNSTFAWYNDDERLAILCEDTSNVSGERTQERYDTYQGSDVTNGIRITFHSKYDTISSQTQDLKTDAGLDSGLHPMVLCYIKARLFEDAGDIERASYYRRMFESGVHKYPLRKSGVRALAVPRI